MGKRKQGFVKGIVLHNEAPFMGGGVKKKRVEEGGKAQYQSILKIKVHDRKKKRLQRSRTGEK